MIQKSCNSLEPLVVLNQMTRSILEVLRSLLKDEEVEEDGMTAAVEEVGAAMTMMMMTYAAGVVLEPV